jgi:protoporphyrinogen oxidase
VRESYTDEVGNAASPGNLARPRGGTFGAWNGFSCVVGYLLWPSAASEGSAAAHLAPISPTMDRHTSSKGSSVPRCVVVGAGPAGLTAAHVLARAGRATLVLEADSVVGGISRTAEYRGYRFDVGGHRFFTKVEEVQRLWEEMLGEEFLTRPRLSRIHYGGRLFDYPLKPLNALRSLGPIEALRVVASYARARVAPHRDERTFEQWVTNRFGRRLFEIFFKTYTEKVWGMPCSEISADWAAQRIKNLDLVTAVKNALFGASSRDGEVVTTLIEQFQYPRLGPGQMWEACTAGLVRLGSEVRMEAPVTRVLHADGRVTAVEVGGAAGETVETVEVDDLLSSMPLRTLLTSMSPAPPPEVLEAAESLRYRDFLTVALIVDAPDVFPDNWIYIHSPEVHVGRIQNYKNWSPALVPDPSRTALGLEYFVQEGDALWTAADCDLVTLATEELERLKLVPCGSVVDGTVLRMPKAYPVYDDVYRRSLEVIRGWLAGIENLQVIGRNGQHRYNNQDHSMMTGVLAAENLCGGMHDIWDVNVDDEYHEEQVGKNRSSGDRLVPTRAAAS